MPIKKQGVETTDKKLKVQIGVCKRMKKEVAAYEKEVITNEARVQKMKDEGRDIYDIRKQEEVLQESYMMVPDSKNRFQEALNELNNLLEQYAEDAEVTEETRTEARAILAESS
mmetsp:Transcript_26453/g.28845  ORF Transcript_26453/g.28845 Transcript_26453/m.28845 type:complete len:114 (+) Transcript_26453:82-423(+)